MHYVTRVSFSHVLAFCRAAVAEIADYVQMPTTDKEKEIAQRWEAKWAFPQEYGAIYLR